MSRRRPDPMRPSASLALTLAAVSGTLGCLVAVVVALTDLPASASLLSAAAAGFAFVLAISAWIHEGRWRWRTLECLGLGLAALVLGPFFAYATATLGWGGVIVAGLLLASYFLS